MLSEWSMLNLYTGNTGELNNHSVIDMKSQLYNIFHIFYILLYSKNNNNKVHAMFYIQLLSAE